MTLQLHHISNVHFYEIYAIAAAQMQPTTVFHKYTKWTKNTMRRLAFPAPQPLFYVYANSAFVFSNAVRATTAGSCSHCSLLNISSDSGPR